MFMFQVPLSVAIVVGWDRCGLAQRTIADLAMTAVDVTKVGACAQADAQAARYHVT
jgi:hypothetical protein